MRQRASDRSTRPLHARAAALLACLIAFGCGSGEPSAPEPPESEGASAPAGETAADAPARPAAEPVAPGEVDPDTVDIISSEGVIPEDYPRDVPVYPGSEPGPAVSMPGLGLFATFESDDSVDSIMEHFRGELAKNGWTVEDAPSGGLDATKEDRAVQVRIRPNEEGRTEIAVNVET